MERIISVTDLIRNAAQIAREVEDGTIYHVTRAGRGSMVLMDDEYFAGWIAAIEELQRPGWREAWARSDRDIAARRGRNLDAITKELGLDDSSHSTGRATASRAAGTRRGKGRPSSLRAGGPDGGCTLLAC